MASRVSCSLVIMDTPYRFQALLADIAGSPLKGRRVFVATELNGPGEFLYRGKVDEVIRKTAGLKKVEFVAVIEPSR
jgi:16S rRNA C1402 (ribose-2'-O) methylase RsmI